METFPRAIAARLGSSLLLETSVAGLRHGKANGKPWFEVDITRHNHSETLPASAVVIATPTNIASQILLGLSDQFTPLFSRIEYAPVAVVSACYRREQMQHPADGFGFLVPRSEGLRVLGTVFNSALFAGRAPDGMACFTSFAGGATDPKLCELSDEEITGNHLRRSRARPRHHGKACSDKPASPRARHAAIQPGPLPNREIARSAHRGDAGIVSCRKLFVRPIHRGLRRASHSDRRSGSRLSRVDRSCGRGSRRARVN